MSNFTDNYTFCSMVVTDVRQSGDDVQCFVCRKGKQHKKPLVKCYFKSKYLRELDEQQYACFMCLKRTLKQNDVSLNIAQGVYNKQKAKKEYPRVFDLLQEYPNMHQHPIVHGFITSVQSGKKVTPNMASDALRILLIFSNDVCLRENFLWLKQQEICENNRFEELLQKHTGIYGVWPTIDDKDYVKQLRL